MGIARITKTTATVVLTVGAGTRPVTPWKTQTTATWTVAPGPFAQTGFASLAKTMSPVNRIAAQDFVVTPYASL